MSLLSHDTKIVVLTCYTAKTDWYKARLENGAPLCSTLALSMSDTKHLLCEGREVFKLFTFTLHGFHWSFWKSRAEWLLRGVRKQYHCWNSTIKGTKEGCVRPVLGLVNRLEGWPLEEYWEAKTQKVFELENKELRKVGLALLFSYWLLQRNTRERAPGYYLCISYRLWAITIQRSATEWKWAEAQDWAGCAKWKGWKAASFIILLFPFRTPLLIKLCFNIMPNKIFAL